ncbi:hypothetical protein [Pseudomonas marginalis]|uniref:hypothetical protein n=1 Tax=Pseudomonas marginalis TaxID=298 RepID=UPI0020347BE4|nr:hypothetical protein [Pseudomonas marginalis]MCM2377835.1 hypothetical protein [Pseudomonas marginalis]
MKSNIVEVAGGTFVVTAVSYATGIAYYNAFFRKLNANPDLFSVPLERILFEGGRQLLAIVFQPIMVFILAMLAATIVNMVLNRLGCVLFNRISESVKHSALWASFGRFSWAYIFLIMSIVTSFSFGTGKEAGERYAQTTECTAASVKTESSTLSGCVVYKTDAEIWLVTIKKSEKLLVNIPSDKYLMLEIY